MRLRFIGRTFAIALNLPRLRGNGHSQQQALSHLRMAHHQELVKPPSRWRLCLSLFLHRKRDSGRRRGPVFTRKERRKTLFLQYVRFAGASKFHVRRVREVTVCKNRGSTQNYRHKHQRKQVRDMLRETPHQIVPFNVRRFK